MRQTSAVNLHRAVALPSVAVAIMVALIGCARSEAPPAAAPSAALAAPTAAPIPATMLDEATPATPTGAQPRLASDPAQLADDLVADESAIRDPSTPPAALVAAARRQQAAYRAIGRHPEWDAIIVPRIPASLIETYNRNVDARRQLNSMTPLKDTVPPWRIQPPAPAEDLLAFYREAEAASGVGWNYLAAINLIETRFGSYVHHDRKTGVIVQAEGDISDETLKQLTEQADRLIVGGFFDEVVRALPVAAAVPAVRARIAAKLDRTAGDLR